MCHVEGIVEDCRALRRFLHRQASPTLIESYIYRIHLQARCIGLEQKLGLPGPIMEHVKNELKLADNMMLRCLYKTEFRPYYNTFRERKRKYGE
jgi:hypothetical protein